MNVKVILACRGLAVTMMKELKKILSALPPLASPCLPLPPLASPCLALPFKLPCLALRGPVRQARQSRSGGRPVPGRAHRGGGSERPWRPGGWETAWWEAPRVVCESKSSTVLVQYGKSGATTVPLAAPVMS